MAAPEDNRLRSVSFDVEWVTDRSRFGELGPEWEALLPADAYPFDTHTWHSAWLDSIGAGMEMAVCTVWREGRLRGAYPLRRDGPLLRELGDVNSSVVRPLATDAEAMAGLLDAVFVASPEGIEVPLPVGDPTVAAVFSRARRARMYPVGKEVAEASVVDTTGDVTAWRKGSHGSWKSRLARYRRKMERDHEAEIDLVVAPTDLEEWVEDGLQVEAGGWKGREGTAILSDPATAAFYRDVARRFHERDQLRISRIRLDGDTVAFSFCLLTAGRLWSLKAGYDESWRKLVPGLVLQLSIVERCFETDVELYELLGVTSDWKAKIETGSRRWTMVHVYPAGAAGAARGIYHRHLRPILRDVYRRVRPLDPRAVGPSRISAVQASHQGNR